MAAIQVQQEPSGEVVPTKWGRDILSVDGNHDAHIRLEQLGRPGESMGAWYIAADVFDSRISNPRKAHIDSAIAPNTSEGALTITEFLRDYGFDTTVTTGEP